MRSENNSHRQKNSRKHWRKNVRLVHCSMLCLALLIKLKQVKLHSPFLVRLAPLGYALEEKFLLGCHYRNIGMSPEQSR